MDLKYKQYKTLQSALVYKKVWDDSLTESQINDIHELEDLIQIELAFSNDSVEIDGLFLENTSGL